jgi:hypothetical protein
LTGKKKIKETNQQKEQQPKTETNQHKKQKEQQPKTAWSNTNKTKTTENWNFV